MWVRHKLIVFLIALPLHNVLVTNILVRAKQKFFFNLHGNIFVHEFHRWTCVDLEIHPRRGVVVAYSILRVPLSISICTRIWNAVPCPLTGNGIWNNLKQFYFHKTWYRIYMLHWNLIHKSTGVTWNVGPYKLIRLPGHHNLNLNLNLI